MGGGSRIPPPIWLVLPREGTGRGLALSDSPMRGLHVMIGTLAGAVVLGACAGDGREVRSLPPSAPAESVDQLLGEACRQGRRAACDLHVLLTLWLEDGPDLPARLRRLLAAQCEAGAPESCVDLARMQRDGAGGRADEAAALDSLFVARRLFHESCLNGIEISCPRARLTWPDWRSFSRWPDDPAAITAALEQRCASTLGRPWDPDQMSHWLRGGKWRRIIRRLWPRREFGRRTAQLRYLPPSTQHAPPGLAGFDEEIWQSRRIPPLVTEPCARVRQLPKCLWTNEIWAMDFGTVTRRDLPLLLAEPPLHDCGCVPIF